MKEGAIGFSCGEACDEEVTGVAPVEHNRGILSMWLCCALFWEGGGRVCEGKRDALRGVSRRYAEGLSMNCLPSLSNPYLS